MRRSLRPKAWGLLSARCLTGGLAMLAYYWSFSPVGGNTDLGSCAMLLKTAPLYVALLAPWLLKERPGRGLGLALALGLLGVGLRYGGSLEVERLGVLFALLAGFLSALAYMALRGLARAGESPWSVVFGFSWFLLLAPLPWLLPVVQIAMLTSVYATVLLSFERYVRIVFICNFKHFKYFNEENFK